jgi:hypothetical protein
MTIERTLFPPQEVEIVDTVGIPEVFAEALARVERIGPNRRLVFTVTQPVGRGDKERVAVVKLILPAETSMSVAQMLLNDTPEPLAFASLSHAVAH